MKKLYILPLILASIFATGCSKEDPFKAEETSAEGQILKSALSVDVIADGMISTRAGADADINDFNIIFTREGSSQPTAKYTYGSMPEVVVLPAGKYTCTATYGEDRLAEWDNPYYVGKSSVFEVKAYEICSYIDPIECKLENVMVSIDFDPALRNAMSADSKVDVKVGSSSSLSFGTAEADAGRAGFFKYSDEVSLVAVFTGKIDGVDTVETKSLTNIGKGNHYKIRFKLHTGNSGSAEGDIDTDVSVDASVTVVDVAYNVTLGEDPLLDDSERPSESGGDDPSGPDDPEEPQLPTISGEAPVDIDAVNNGNTMTQCVINIHSYADGGIQEFTCDIVSPALSPEELAGVSLSDHLDLVNPGALEEPLSGLGFPVNVGGQHDVQFVLTGFLPMLQMVASQYPGQVNNFILTVKDANGTTTKTLQIVY